MAWLAVEISLGVPIMFNWLFEENYAKKYLTPIQSVMSVKNQSKRKQKMKDLNQKS